MANTEGHGALSTRIVPLAKSFHSQVHWELASAVMRLYLDFIVRRVFDPNQREQDCRIIRASPSGVRQ
jgi:hypothetical protein